MPCRVLPCRAGRGRVLPCRAGPGRASPARAAPTSTACCPTSSTPRSACSSWRSCPRSSRPAPPPRSSRWSSGSGSSPRPACGSPLSRGWPTAASAGCGGPPSSGGSSGSPASCSSASASGWPPSPAASREWAAGRRQRRPPESACVPSLTARHWVGAWHEARTTKARAATTGHRTTTAGHHRTTARHRWAIAGHRRAGAGHGELHRGSGRRAGDRGQRGTRAGGAAPADRRVRGRGAVRCAARRRAGTGTGWLTTQVVAMAPRLRVRDEAALRAQFPGKSTEEIADALIVGASRGSGAVGGAVGAWAALPVLPAFPVELVTETLALIGIELKLIAELHEVYGMAPPGSTVDRATAYIGAWAHRRGVLAAPGGLILVAGSPLGRRLRLRLAGRAGRSAFSLGPLFTGAAAGAVLNSRETRRLGLDVRADLRRRAGGTGPEVARRDPGPELEA